MTLGRALIALGVILIVVGVLFQLAPALRLGRLPGDISFGGQNWRVYLPIGTSIVISVFLSLAFMVFSWFASRR